MRLCFLSSLIVLAEHLAFAHLEIAEVFLGVDSYELSKLDHLNNGVLVYGYAVLLSVLGSEDLLLTVGVDAIVAFCLGALTSLTTAR